MNESLTETLSVIKRVLITVLGQLRTKAATELRQDVQIIRRRPKRGEWTTELRTRPCLLSAIDKLGPGYEHFGNEITDTLRKHFPKYVGVIGTSIQSFPKCSYPGPSLRSEEHTSELQSHSDLVCRLLLEKKKK